MLKKRMFYIGFFLVLILLFFAALVKYIPDFTTRKLPPIGKVQNFDFIDQDGKDFTRRNMEGKVVAVNYFFTTCTSVCPRMNHNLLTIFEKFRNEPSFMIVSHTSDPERDSAAQLKNYAKSLGVDQSNWIFLTGRKDSLYSMARHSYMIDDPKNFVQNVHNDFLHTQFVALVNKEGEVVHIYDGLKPSELAEMSTQIEKLLHP